MSAKNPSNGGGTGTSEGIAYKLFAHVLAIEGRNLHPKNEGEVGLSRNFILDTYSQCLDAVKGKRPAR